MVGNWKDAGSSVGIHDSPGMLKKPAIDGIAVAKGDSNLKLLLPFFAFFMMTLVKVILFGLLFVTGRAAPFVGDNATDHYLATANRLLEEGRYNGPDSRKDSKVPIGYPAFLASVRAISGKYFLPTVVGIQFLIDLVVACLLYLLSGWVASPRAGFLAGVFWLVYPPAIGIATWITSETLFTCVLLVSILFLCVSIQRDRGIAALLSGLTLGVATLIRGTCLYFPPLFLVAWWAMEGKRGLKKGALFASGLICVVLPWFFRNLIVLDDPIVVSVGIGSVVLQGSDENCFTIAGKESHYPSMYQEAMAAGWVSPLNGKESRSDNRALWVGLHNYWSRLQQRPLSFFPLMFHKAVRLWYGTESGGLAQQAGLSILSLFIVPAEIWQITRWWFSQRKIALLMGSLLLYFAFLHWITLPLYRYMHPIYPVLLLGGCQTLTEVYYVLRKPRAVDQIIAMKSCGIDVKVSG
jgi:4-amino-4-deoxy-L-arabinose transferase-like glycosyltransferase